jgi:deoxyadenosine/deoxycytidine kinase
VFVVELVGLPGVGKSSISKALAERITTEAELPSLTSQDAYLYAFRRHSDRMCRLLLTLAPYVVARRLLTTFQRRTIFQHEQDVEFLLNHFGLVNALFDSPAFQNMPCAERRFIVKGVLQGGSMYQSLRSLEHYDKVVVFDEGFVQASLATSSPGDLLFDSEVSLAFLSHAPRPDLLIYLRADIDTCVRRMLARPKGIPHRLRQLEMPRLRESLRLMDESLTAVVTALSSAGVRTVELASQQSIGKTVDTVIGGIAPVLAACVGDAREDRHVEIRR